jgi:hypothetical protein
MAGGMSRRGERISLHERIHGTPPPQAEEFHLGETRPAIDPPQVRHCWVTDEHDRLPGLLLEWRRMDSGWQGRVVRPVLEEGAWVVVEEWLAAGQLKSAEVL